jgi:hypothetical protein
LKIIKTKMTETILDSYGYNAGKGALGKGEWETR